METETLKAPFVYFGGKSTVAPAVWRALGQPKTYIEPFFGSGAVLLARPGYKPDVHIEDVCDADGFISNIWRAINFHPDETAKWCDWPVNHADLMARRRVLLANEQHLLDNLVKDDMWCDVKLAGYYIWAASCWIGSGLTCPNAIPHLGHAGAGVHKQSLTGKRPHLADAGMGVHKQSLTGQRPHLGDAGKGVHKQSLTVDSTQDLGAPYKPGIYAWFRRLSERLRNVRVVCGDWTRVCGGDWQDKMGDVGIFFDPPYTDDKRDGGVYHCESQAVELDVAKWCLERGNRPTYRIVLACYSDHQDLIKAGWTVKNWKTGGGYGNTARDNKQTQGKENAKRELLYFSPGCYFFQEQQALTL